MGTKISGMTDGTSALGTDKIEVSRSGTTRYVTVDYIATYVSSSNSLDACQVKRTADRTTTTGTADTIPFTAENYDTNTMHDNVTNNTRITIKTTGVYLVTFVGVFSANSTGYRYSAIYKNGTDVMDLQPVAPVTGQLTGLKNSIILSLAANDYLEVQIKQNSGGNLDLLALDYYSPIFTVQQLS